VIVPQHRDYVEPVALPRNVIEVEVLVRSVGAKLLIIDPIVAAIVVELDAHKDQHVRTVLARLAKLADEVDCAVDRRLPKQDALHGRLYPGGEQRGVLERLPLGGARHRLSRGLSREKGGPR
jgi:hypothetical protein